MPPLVDVAVNVTCWPEQIVVCEAAMTTDAGPPVLTAIVISFETTEDGEAQAIEEAINNLILSPLTSDDV